MDKLCRNACYKRTRNLASSWYASLQISSLQCSRLLLCILTWMSNPPPLTPFAPNMSVAPAKVKKRTATKFSPRPAGSESRMKTTPGIDLQGLFESSKRTGFQGARRAIRPRTKSRKPRSLQPRQPARSGAGRTGAAAEGVLATAYSCCYLPARRPGRSPTALRRLAPDPTAPRRFPPEPAVSGAGFPRRRCSPRPRLPHGGRASRTEMSLFFDCFSGPHLFVALRAFCNVCNA